MMTEYDTNQTQFAESQPLFQNVAIPELDKKHDEEVPEKKSSPSKKIFIALGIFGVLFLLLILMLLTRKKPMEEAVIQVIPTPSPVISSDNPLRARVKNLQMELDAADPKNQLLVFPPINMDLYLDRIPN